VTVVDAEDGMRGTVLTRRDSGKGEPIDAKGSNVLFNATRTRGTLWALASREARMDRCHTHSHDEATGICRSCRREFCEQCLVYSYGHNRPPYCVRCALIAAGTIPDEGWVAEYTISA
jgi:hypothetical protein